ncbi:nucleotidyltransferase domain-containing protein [Streptomyces sp. NPDC048304]|uniref:nucleotidyltransferase family protein n=1 Tax=Streptomyces sp. NPDC048304 TaxID=3154820 RepID=UPI0033DAF5E0
MFIGGVFALVPAGAACVEAAVVIGPECAGVGTAAANSVNSMFNGGADDGVEDTGAPGSGVTPQGLTAEQFADAARTVRAGAGHLGDDIVVQGSRASGTARPDSDLDLAIRVSPDRFDELIRQRFGTPNPGSAKERTMLWAMKTGKIQAGEAGVSGVRRALEAQLGMDVDLSVIRQGGPFDNPPFIEVPDNG